MAALRYILLAAAITLTLALLAHLRLPARDHCAHPFPGARAAAGLASRC